MNYSENILVIVDAADERPFWKVLHHVLDELLPPKSDTHHNLKKRRHNQTLSEKQGHLSVKNFLVTTYFISFLNIIP